VLAVGIALLLQLSLIPLIGGDPRSSPFLLFFAAVMVAAWSGGFWSGLLATLLSALLGAYFFLFSLGAPGLANAAQDLRWAVFVLEGGLISALVEMIHSARRRAEAQALEVQRGEASIRLRAREQRAVAELGQRALTGVDVSELMGDVVRRVSEVLEVEYCKLLELRSGEDLLERAGVGWKEDSVGGATANAGAYSWARRTLASRESVILNDLGSEAGFGDSLLHEHGVVSGVGVTIELEGRPFGVLGAFAGKRRVFAKEDADFLQSVASVLAATMERRQVERGLRFLAESGEVLSSSLNYRETLASVARLAVPDLADWCVVDVLGKGGAIERLAVVHRDPQKMAWACELQGRYPPDPEAPGGVSKVLSTGRPELLSEITDEVLEASARDGEHLDIMRELGFTSALVVPLVVSGETAGAVTMVSAESGRRYGMSDLNLAMELARRAALAVDNAHLYDRAQREIAERSRMEEALRLSERRFRALVQKSPDVISVFDAEGQVLYQSQSMERILGDKAGARVGESIFDSALVHPDDLDRAREFFVETRTNPGVSVKAELRLRGADGSWRHIEATGKNLLHDLAVGGIAVNYRDISERTRDQQQIRELNEELERRIEDRTASLVEANEELESFSYSVSHDLRAPLRHIGGFAQMLRRRSGSSLDEVSARYLDTILSSVEHAGNLVEGLLAFSRMGRAGMRRTVVNMNRLVDAVKSDLQLEVGGRKIAWKVGELPDVLGDPSMLRLVVENLLSNAVKYTRDRDRAVISVGSTYDEREATFFVEDNGVGFDIKYKEKLFGVFQRLHTSEEFEGTGIGLATVRRVVNRHGGRVWAEGREEKGATFFFSLHRPAETYEG
jgi:PAS domain S-box-containing protein